jgi:hypothetical protein
MYVLEGGTAFEADILHHHFFCFCLSVKAAVLMKQTFAHSSGSTLVRVQVSYAYVQ